jgi:glucosyl-3-phosphoglycerate phosphatase
MAGPGLWSVRHAETGWNRRRVFMGGLDVPPAPDALARAAELGTTLVGAADHVFSSPLRRAVCTAAALFPGVAVTTDDRLRERGMGEWEGRAKADVQREHPEAYPHSYLDVTVTPPGGEELASLLGRVRSFLADVAPLAGGARVFVVSHNGWIRAAQHLGGHATLAAFHMDPVPPLVPTPLPIAPDRLSPV